MSYQILNGQLVSQEIKQFIKDQVFQQVAEGKKRPHLAALIVGDDGASHTYVNAKVKDCEAMGFSSTLRQLPASCTEEEVLAIIEEFNHDDDIDGFIVQLPLPDHISVQKVTDAIAPEKDVDGFHPVNIGKMSKNLPSYVSATPLGILKLLEAYKIPTKGRHVVVVGRSHIVGSPMSILMGRNDYPGNATVTLTHRHTQNLASFTSQADILIVAVGIPSFITSDMVKDGATVIDVGITRVPDETKKSGFRLVGDVDFNSVAPKCAFITPVPGGVGPMTRAGLMYNTWLASQGNIFAQRVDNTFLNT
ncbi:MAG: bifunctional 5,10-methylene-tetrahydrofolate dehydrogenase/5,10-methylene-tetrahydrofolate cyclohydrolase [Cyclobacteriaceae bacterium]|nr:bifunctional 5,10-methylene-tetrahydrofolate dehydrogenase/5,10-methylene-tetrahydrofolate cyclohydrolase [Cyclobacteriaceae bacterium]MCH8515503.1 bifunctional 5,10-methylene-tetrahydrofolate dehydrogenase/5,10-methylene-tetrahydrofolate cyclohydrolase [Cyclobacteriaceae bacterium]